jgi:hypothetical protein
MTSRIASLAGLLYGDPPAKHSQDAGLVGTTTTFPLHAVELFFPWESVKNRAYHTRLPYVFEYHKPSTL